VAWHFTAEKPIYTQIKEVICVMIATGQYPAGSKFPPVREIAATAGVNPNTMQKALSDLEADGFLYSTRTAGRTVTENTDKIDSLRHDIASDAAKEYLLTMDSLGKGGADAVNFLEQIVSRKGGEKYGKTA
jgi:DNA-binding transcriptional regulator YhcF (GntR family)